MLKPTRVTLGENATFNCRFPGADAAIEWKVDNVSLSKQIDINISDHIKPNVSGDIHILTIKALESYNGTIVKCLARSVSNRCREKVESDSVNLLLQGNFNTMLCMAQ